VRRRAGFFVSTKADFSDDSELSELKSNAGDGQKGKQICVLWNVASGKAIGQPLRHREEVYGIEFNSDGRRVATCSARRNGLRLGWIIRKARV
jgi:WD40 repeat protein